MPVEGNGLAKLSKLARRLNGFERIVDRTMHELQTETLALVKEGFRAESDPTGRRWRRKKYPDGRKVLHGKTGRLRQYQRGRATRKLFGVRAGARYWRFHQYGTPRLVPRKQLADSSTGLPPRWRRRWQKRAFNVVRKAFTL